MRAVITGAAGFIGSHLAERLVDEGWRVTGVDAFTSYYEVAAKEANLAGLAHEPRFELVRADVATAPLRRLLAERPLVIHLAAQPGVRGSFGDGFSQYVHDNVLATQRVFEAALDAGCPRVVYAS
ncbi:MAG: NAD-dependent epimerase/dehydratase family protein, partial [Propionibacteriales bacterium]|nr:NAD-dependent epimerase/dehydratase family protein [Propionibacteriales bacterium]